MDSVQTQTHKGENYILKTNLWKFFKTLRAQANPLYCLLVASTIDVAFVEIVGREDGVRHRRLSIAQFIAQLGKLPTKQVAYHISIKVWGEDGEALWSASRREHLSMDVAAELLPAMIMHLCRSAASGGHTFVLTPEVINHYHFRRRYIEELALLVSNCNARIASENLNQSNKSLKNKEL
jgi:hypothetical protein